MKKTFVRKETSITLILWDGTKSTFEEIKKDIVPSLSVYCIEDLNNLLVFIPDDDSFRGPTAVVVGRWIDIRSDYISEYNEDMLLSDYVDIAEGTEKKENGLKKSKWKVWS